MLVALLLSTTGDWDAALAGFLAVGTTAVGALALGRRWWPFYVSIATSVLLALLLAPDAHAAFGLVFLAACAMTILGVRSRRGRPTARVC